MLKVFHELLCLPSLSTMQISPYKVGALLANKRTGGWLQKGREISILTVECSMKKIRVYSTTANAYIASKAANVACRF